MPESDQPTGPTESRTALTPFAAQVGSALDAAGIDWQQDEDGDLHVTLIPEAGQPLRIFFRTLQPAGQWVLLVVVYDMLPGVNTPALLPLSRGTVLEVLNWIHQHQLGLTLSIGPHNYLTCECAFPVYGRPSRDQVATMFHLVLAGVNHSQAALLAALHGSSLEQALRLVANSPGPDAQDHEPAA